MSDDKGSWGREDEYGVQVEAEGADAEITCVYAGSVQTRPIRELARHLLVDFEDGFTRKEALPLRVYVREGDELVEGTLSFTGNIAGWSMVHIMRNRHSGVETVASARFETPDAIKEGRWS